MPPITFGSRRVDWANLEAFWAHRKDVIVWFTALRKEPRIRMGRACRWYNNQGILFILTIPQQPNQEKSLCCQD